MTTELAAYHGITAEQARENYLHALAQLVTYLFAGIKLDLLMRPDYDCFLYSRHRVPTPEGTAAVIGFQAAEHARANPVRLRTIELVPA